MTLPATERAVAADRGRAPRWARTAPGRRPPLRVLGLALLVALAGACGGESPQQAGQTGGRPGAGGRPGGAGGNAVPLAVGVADVTRGSIARSVSVSGVLEPLRTVVVNAQMAGTLLQVPVEEGSAVSRGHVLARIDDREIRAQLRAAEASLELARTAFERAQRLYDRQVITQAEFDAERAALTAAEAQVDQLSTRASYAVIQAPLDGVVTERVVQAGDVVGNQSRMFTVADLSVLVVRVGVSELDVVNIRESDPVELSLDAFPNRPLNGRVRRIFPSADPATRLVPVEVALDAEAETLARPGFLARATFSVGLLEDVLLIPAGALASTGASPSVFVVEDDRVRRRPVRTGLTSQGRVQVLEGLEEGEVVVTQGVSRLREGATVRIVPEAT